MPFDVDEWWSRGWIRFPRNAFKREVLTREARQLLTELVYLAYWDDATDRRSGEPICRGQYRCTASFLANRMRRTVGQIRRDLILLETAGLIEREAGHSYRGQLITVCDYERYQGRQTGARPAGDRRETGERPSDRKQRTSAESRETGARPARDRRETGGNNPIEEEKHISNGSKDDDIAPDLYLKIISEQWQTLGLNRWRWDATALKWHRQGVGIRTAVAAMLLGAARGNGIVSLKYFEPLFPEAERILAESPSYFGYVRGHLARVIGG